MLQTSFFARTNEDPQCGPAKWPSAANRAPVVAGVFHNVESTSTATPHSVWPPVKASLKYSWKRLGGKFSRNFKPQHRAYLTLSRSGSSNLATLIQSELPYSPISMPAKSACYTIRCGLIAPRSSRLIDAGSASSGIRTCYEKRLQVATNFFVQI